MKRSDLYNAVWKDPVFHVAKRLGLSDSRLSTICKHAEIPTPPRGYWRQLQTGQVPERTSLPRPDDDTVVPLKMDDAPSIPAKSPAEVRQTIDSEKVEGAPSPKAGSAVKTDWLELLPGENLAASSVKCEYQQLLSLASLFEQHQAASRFLDHLEDVAGKESLRTATILRRWVAAMRKHQAEAGPVEMAMKEFRALSFSRQRPVWWDSV